MISKSMYKDRPAIKIYNEKFEALFLPEDGAKLVSFKTKRGKELFAEANNEKYKRLFIDSSYIDSECSAFDDMFPTIDPCVINKMDYLDHGQVCRIEHNYEIKDTEVIFSCNIENLNITYNKTVFIEDDKLCIKYEIKNMNEFDFPYLWAGHMMFMGEEKAQVLSDFSDEDIEIMFGRPPVDAPVSRLSKFGEGVSFKYYYTKDKTPLKCGILYPESALKVSVEFDESCVKYLGVWLNPGDFKGMYNVALEPCTALFDDPIRAKKAGAESVIRPGEVVCFTMKVSCKEI